MNKSINKSVNKSVTVYNYLKEKILANELKPGEPINIQALSEVLSISKIPIREAIKKLESIGLVETIHNRGARVKKLDLDELEQIMMIRLELEVMATRLCAKHIDKKTIKKLYRLVEEMEQERLAGREDKYSIINRDFHCTIYKSSQAYFLYGLIEDLWDRSERTRWIFHLFPERFQLSNKEHYEIVQALENGDVESACRLVKKQKEEGFLNVIKFLKEYEARKQYLTKN